MSERRDSTEILTQLRVDVGVIKEKVTNNETTVARVESKVDEMNTRINDAVFRPEYERRHKEIDDKAETALVMVRDQRSKGQVWRWVFTAALGVLGLIEAILHR